MTLTFHDANDWKSDQYRLVNKGVTPSPSEMPKLHKYYYHIDQIQLSIGMVIDTQRNIFLVHYNSDGTIAIDFSHN